MYRVTGDEILDAPELPQASVGAPQPFVCAKTDCYFSFTISNGCQTVGRSRI
jgi:hypothetical protein